MKNYSIQFRLIQFQKIYSDASNLNQPSFRKVRIVLLKYTARDILNEKPSYKKTTKPFWEEIFSEPLGD